MSALIIDRIEGDRAVLSVGGEVIEVPTSVLPKGSHEGATLLLRLGQATATAEDPTDRIQRLAARNKLPDDMEL